MEVVVRVCVALCVAAYERAVVVKLWYCMIRIIRGIRQPPTVTLTFKRRGWGWGAFSKIRSRARSRPVSFDPAREMLWDHGPVESGRLRDLRLVPAWYPFHGSGSGGGREGGGMSRSILFFSGKISS